MSELAAVLDASALLAAMQDEAGADVIAERMATACIGAVNLSEVIAKLQERGVPDALIDQSIDDLDLCIIPFDRELAVRAGKMRLATKDRGLSLGDRACLALAERLALPALTTDAAWAQLDLAVGVEVLR